MDQKSFNEGLERRIELMRGTLAKKGEEYTVNEDDRFHNFKRAAAIIGGTPEQALVGMFVKHLVSVLDIVDALSPDTFPSIETIEEKCGDAINYLVLLEIMLKERNAVFTKSEACSQMAYDVWAATTPMPGEGLEDVIHRIQSILIDYGTEGIRDTEKRVDADDVWEATAFQTNSGSEEKTFSAVEFCPETMERAQMEPIPYSKAIEE